MLNRRTLAKINAQPKQVNRALLALIAAASLVLTAVVFVLTSALSFSLIFLAAGAVAVLLAYRSQKARTTTTLTYANLDGQLEARFAAVREGCEALSESERIWHLKDTQEPVAGRPPGAAARVTGAKVRAGDAAVPPPREAARVGLLETPGVRAGVPIWGIEAGRRATLHFFPEAVLVYRDGRYEGFSYESLAVRISSAPYYEREEVPGDAKVVTERRARSQMPVALYTLVEIDFPRGLEVRLLVSSRRAAARFVKGFGVESRKSPRLEGQAWAGEDRKRRGAGEAEESDAYHDVLDMKDRARIASAYTTLGVPKGASLGEISAAYKRLARAHHPDKVANLPEEDREESERQMKEINAAYTELKRVRKYLADGAG